MITGNLPVTDVYISTCFFPSADLYHHNAAKNLVTHLLIPDPKKRATVYAALKSFWITSDLADLERAYRDRIRSVTS